MDVYDILPRSAPRVQSCAQESCGIVIVSQMLLHQAQGACSHSVPVSTHGDLEMLALFTVNQHHRNEPPRRWACLSKVLMASELGDRDTVTDPLPCLVAR